MGRGGGRRRDEMLESLLWSERTLHLIVRRTMVVIT